MELDQGSGFEGALKWMEGGGPHLTWLLLPDAFQLDGNRRVWGMEKATECAGGFVKPSNTHRW